MDLQLMHIMLYWIIISRQAELEDLGAAAAVTYVRLSYWIVKAVFLMLALSDWSFGDFIPTLAAPQGDRTTPSGPDPLAMLDYCSDRTTCRHILFKHYFAYDTLASTPYTHPVSSQETLQDDSSSTQSDCCDNCTGVHWAYTERLDETSSAHRILLLLNKVLLSTKPGITILQLASLYLGLDETFAWRALNNASLKRLRSNGGIGHHVTEVRQIVETLISQRVLRMIKQIIPGQENREYVVYYLQVGP